MPPKCLWGEQSPSAIKDLWVATIAQSFHRAVAPPVPEARITTLCSRCRAGGSSFPPLPCDAVKQRWFLLRHLEPAFLIALHDSISLAFIGFAIFRYTAQRAIVDLSSKNK